MNCKQVRELLPLYADGDLEGKQYEAVAKHLAGCEECRRRLAVDRELTAELSQLPAHAATVAVPPTLRQGVMRKIERGDRWQPLRHAATMMGNATALIVWLALVGLAIGALTMLGKPIVESANGTPSATAVPAGQVEGTPVVSPVGAIVPQFGEPKTLLATVQSDYQVSPDGRWMVYARPSANANDNGLLGELVAENVETGKVVVLLSGSSFGMGPGSYVWLPNSQAVVIVTHPTGTSGPEILLQGLDGQPPMSLAKLPAEAQSFGRAVVSPDGQKIAYTVLYDASPAPVSEISIQVSSLLVFNSREVVAPDFFVASGGLTWTPDSRQVVYFKGKDGTPPEDGETYVVDAADALTKPEGTAPESRLLLARAKVAAWSPDGTKALWLSEPAKPNGTADLSVSGWPDPSAAQALATDVSATGAAWAGSDNWVVYARDGALYLAAASGEGEPRRLTSAQERADQPAWLPGKGIVYRSSQGGATVAVRLLPLVQAPSGPAPAVNLGAALRSLHMVSHTTGWALAGNEILRTTNGGSLWNDVTPGDIIIPTDPQDPAASVFPASYFLDTNTAWVAALSEKSSGGLLLHTTDGGRTWAKLEMPTGSGQLYFVDKQNGWLALTTGVAMGSSGKELYRTTDGGQHWELAFRSDPNQPRDDGLPFGGLMTGVGFADLTTGWAVGQTYAQGVAWIYVTHDGGSTWQQQPLPIGSSYKEAMVTLTPPLFFGARDGVLPVQVPSAAEGPGTTIFYTTSDGGSTWTAGTPVAAVGPWDFADAQHGWVVNADGGLLSTRDGGQTWQAIGTLSAVPGGLDFADQQTGWAYGQGDQAPYLLKTSDGGATWTEIKPTVASQPVQPANSPTATPPAVQPAATPPAATTRPCDASDLTGTAWWQGATGSMAGSIVLTNQSSSECLLGGTPSVELTDGEGKALPVSYTTFDKDGKGPQDVLLAPGGQASIFFVWSNWCGAAPALPVTFHIVLPDDKGSIDTPALNPDGMPRDILPRCDAPAAGSILSVGFFAPVAPQPDVSPTSVPPTATAAPTVVAADPAGAVQALLDYYDAINQQQYEQAYDYWQQGGAASGQTLEQFKSGFANTVRTTVLLDEENSQGSGQAQTVVVPTRLMSVVNDQSAPNPERQLVRRFEGTYTLQSTADGWQIASANVQAVADGEGAPADVQDPATLLNSYVSAINAGDYARAYTYWDQLGQASGQTFAEFAGGFAGTKQVSIELGQAQEGGAAGNIYTDVPTLLFAQQSDGTTQTYCGTYTLHRANVPPFDQFGWRISRADIASTSDVQPGSAEAQSLLQNGCK
ncbi:MAG: YCF48-related protein [Chloroflexota bacterium]